jgi:polyisoprenoid-binding protein YceI
MLRALLLSCTLALPAAAQDLPAPVAGEYILDLGHSRLLFKVSHLGFSTYIAPFTDFSGTLQFDPENPTAMQVDITVKVASLTTHYPDPAYDFDATLTGPDFLDAAQFPEAHFTSTAIALTGETTADVTGDLTVHGITKPVTLQVSYNGGWGSMPLDTAGARIGFSVKGSFLRSDFGVGFGVPAPGTTMGVSDEVTLEIETEFTSTSAAVPAP